MPVEYFLRYKGQCYDVGTRLRFYPYSKSQRSDIGVIETFVGAHVFIRGSDGFLYSYSTNPSLANFDNRVIEIIEPVYYIEPPQKKVYGGPLPSEDDIFVGWVWYIVIMLVGTIFNDRLTIWVFASLIFFTWKNGFFNGGKK